MPETKMSLFRTVTFWSRPRIRTLVPWPFSRSICTPGRRCSDSAMFWSGNLPMSSAVTDSMIRFEFFLVFRLF